MKPALTFAAAMLLGFATRLPAEPFQNTNSNDNRSSKVLEARFSPDGKQVVTTTTNGTVRIWDASTGKPLAPAQEADPGQRQYYELRVYITHSERQQKFVSDYWQTAA